MYTLFISNKRVLDVKKNEDGTLLISDENGKSITFAGGLINSQGGIETFLSKCIQSEKSAQEVSKERSLKTLLSPEERIKQQEERAKRKEEYKNSIMEAYNKLLELDFIPSTAENISTVLHYLNLQNWGGWKLPKMEIGYSCNQYDCDGKIATTISLDKPIEYDGEMVSKFQVGAPVGHLIHYRRIIL